MDPADAWKSRYREGDGTLNVARLQEDIEILGKLGAQPIAFIPGAIIETPGRGKVSADMAGWNWLIPILKAHLNSGG